MTVNNNIHASEEEKKIYLHKNDTVVSPAYCQMMMRGEEGGKLVRIDEERSLGAQKNLGVKVIVEPMPIMSESQLLKREEKTIELTPSVQNKELELEVEERHHELDVKLAMEKRDLELALRLQEQEGEVEEDEKEHVEERDVELALDLQEEEVQKRRAWVMSLSGGQR